MVLSGKVTTICDRIEGENENGQWSRQDVVIRTLGEHPKTVALTLSGEKCKIADTLQEGMLIEAYFEPESREHDKRYYTQLRCYAMKTYNAAEPQKAQ